MSAILTHSIAQRLQQHAAWVFNVLLDLYQELDSLSAIQKTVIVSQGEVHHWSSLDLSIDDNSPFLNSVETKDSSLWKVDDWGPHQGAEDTTVRDSEGSSSHILNGELVVTGL